MHLQEAAGDAGSVTAEAAVVLPAIVGLTVTLAAVVAAASHAKLHCTDAARSAARAAARQAAPGQVLRAGRGGAGGPVHLGVSTDTTTVRVVARMPVRGLPAWLGEWSVTAVAVAQVEPGEWAP